MDKKQYATIVTLQDGKPFMVSSFNFPTIALRTLLRLRKDEASIGRKNYLVATDQFHESAF
jgi:hypothetical protein